MAVLPFILTVMYAVSSPEQSYDFSEIRTFARSGTPTFSCKPISPFLAELQGGSMTNRAKIYWVAGNQNQYWTVKANSDGTATVQITHNAAKATVFVLKTEQGDIHQGGRFNIEVPATSTHPSLLVESELEYKVNTPKAHCLPQKLVAKPASLPRAIDRFLNTDSSGVSEENEPATSFTYPIMGINTPSYCSQKPC